MPRLKAPLTTLEVTNLRTDGFYAVGGVSGLYIKVLGSGRSWVYRYYMDGKRHDYGMGSYALLSLKDARETALSLKKMVREKVNPVEARRNDKIIAKQKALKTKTFRECAKSYIEAHQAEWKNPKHIAQWENTLDMYVFPFIGKMPVSEVDTPEVVEILTQQTTGRGKVTGQLWLIKNETAARIRGRIENILDWSAFRKYRSGENPVRWTGHLEHQLPPSGKVKKVKHHNALPYEKIGQFMAELRKKNGLSARALELIILTATRSGEVRGATWDEFDLDKRLWTVDAKRMKMDEPHRIPLSTSAMHLIESLPRVEGTNLLFPSEEGGVMSYNAFDWIYDSLGLFRKITTHGFRSTFRDWGGEMTNYPRDVMEFALAHKEPDATVEAYLRSGLFKKRVSMMEDWAKFCDQITPDTAETSESRLQHTS